MDLIPPGVRLGPIPPPDQEGWQATLLETVDFSFGFGAPQEAKTELDFVFFFNRPSATRQFGVAGSTYDFKKSQDGRITVDQGFLLVEELGANVLSLPHAEAGAHEHAVPSGRRSLRVLERGRRSDPTRMRDDTANPARTTMSHLRPDRREEITVTQQTPPDPPPETPPPQTARAGAEPDQAVGDPRRLARLRQRRGGPRSERAKSNAHLIENKSYGRNELLDDLAWFWDQASKDAAAAAQYLRDKSQAT